MKNIVGNIRKQKRDSFISEMPQDKKGVQFDVNGHKFIMHVRMLSVNECMKLQGVPLDYDWTGITERNRYGMLGNGWQVDTICYLLDFMPKFDRPINVLSLFDGMGCAYLALRKKGIEINYYLSSEINKNCIKAQDNNIKECKELVHLGSVTDINVAHIVEKYGVPDILMGGSPCQDFSFSGTRRGMCTEDKEEVYTLERYLELKNQGFTFKGQSYLFWEYKRILEELRTYNPNILFLLENVNMKTNWEAVISHAMGVRGVHINSNLLSAQSRHRIYWTNFRTKQISSNLFSEYAEEDPFQLPDIATDIPQPEDRGLILKDVIDDISDSKYYLDDERVNRLMRETNVEDLEDYIRDPEVSEEEVFQYLVDKGYDREIARAKAIELISLEKDRLRRIFEGKEVFDA